MALGCTLLFPIVPSCVRDVTSGSPLHRENRENDQNNSVSENPGIWKFAQNPGNNLICSSCKFHDSKGKEYCDICHKNFKKNLEAGNICQVGFMYVIVTNHVNWHRENLRSDKKYTGNYYCNLSGYPVYLLLYYSVSVMSSCPPLSLAPAYGLPRLPVA